MTQNTVGQQCITRESGRDPGGCPYMKMWSYQYRDPHVKDMTVSRPSYLWHWIPIHGKDGLYIEMIKECEVCLELNLIIFIDDVSIIQIIVFDTIRHINYVSAAEFKLSRNQTNIQYGR